jgi:hypothetical protein
VFRQELGEKDVDIPPLPYPLAHVWLWFRLVFNPGGVGFGPFRIPFAEIEAFARSQNLIILPDEALLMRDLSGKFIEVWGDKQTAKLNQQNTAPTPGKPGLKNLVSMRDSQGIKSLFMGLGAKPPKPKRKT